MLINRQQWRYTGSYFSSRPPFLAWTSLFYFLFFCCWKYHLQAALLGVDILMNPERIPPLTKDYYWNKQDCPIPYTQVTWDGTIFWANKMAPINPLCLFRQPSIARSRLTGDLLLTPEWSRIASPLLQRTWKRRRCLTVRCWKRRGWSSTLMHGATSWLTTRSLTTGCLSSMCLTTRWLTTRCFTSNY